MLELITIGYKNIDRIKEYFPAAVYRQIEQKEAVVLGAKCDEVLVGVLVFTNISTDLEIIWMMTTKEHQRQNIAKFLYFSFLEQVAVFAGCRSIHISLEECTESGYLIPFFTRMGFVRMPIEIKSCISKLDVIEQNPLYQMKKEYKNVVFLNELNKGLCDEIKMIMSEELWLDVEPISIIEDYNNEYSACYLSDGQIQSFALIRELTTSYEISMLYTKKGSEMCLMPLLYVVFHKVIQEKKDKNILTLELLNEASERLSRKLLPGAEYHSRYIYELLC